MECAIRRIVWLMSFGWDFWDKQNFKFQPNRFFDPNGSWLSLHRLWKVRFFGCLKRGETVAVTAAWKFFCKEKVGLALKP
jgi:hypothetical protein